MNDEVPIQPIDVDFDNAETGFDALPGDEYRVVLDDLIARQSKKGEVYWGAKFFVKFGEHEGRYIWDSWFPNSPGGLGRLKVFICPAFSVEADGKQELDPDEFIGKSVVVYTTIDEYKGQKRTKIRFDGYEPVGPFKSDEAVEPVQSESFG